MKKSGEANLSKQEMSINQPAANIEKSYIQKLKIATTNSSFGDFYNDYK